MNRGFLVLTGALLTAIMLRCQSPQEQLTASACLERSLAYVGSIGSADLQLSIQVVCPKGQNRGQSFHPDPPYNEYRIESRFEIDRPNGREVAQFINPFNGFIFGGYHLLAEGKYVAYDNVSSTARTIPSLGFENFRHFPHGFLETALEDTSKLIYKGLVPFRDDRAHLVEVKGDREQKCTSIPRVTPCYK